jgi:hypothetical protein
MGGEFIAFGFANSIKIETYLNVHFNSDWLVIAGSGSKEPLLDSFHGDVQPALILLDFHKVAGYDNKAKHHSRGRLCHMNFVGATEFSLRFVLYRLRPSADVSQPGIGWDAMGLTGTNIGVGEG